MERFKSIRRGGSQAADTRVERWWEMDRCAATAMALVTISGFPCSGKSVRAQELAALLSAESSTSHFKIITVNDESVGNDVQGYDDTRAEKPLRAAIMSATVRALDRNTVVICDAMNYIKGFRYQLYCAAREAGVRTLTMHVAAPKERCQEWNASRDQKQYTPATLDNLISRFEEPSPFTRWDSPLIVVPWSDAQLPKTAILDAVLRGNLKPPNQAVVHNSVSSTDYIQRLEIITSAVISALLAALPFAQPGETIALPLQLPAQSNMAQNVKVHITLPPLGRAPPQAAKLQRLRRQYTTLNKQARGTMDDHKLAELFAHFLDQSFQQQ